MSLPESESPSGYARKAEGDGLFSFSDRQTPNGPPVTHLWRRQKMDSLTHTIADAALGNGSRLPESRDRNWNWVADVKWG